MIHGGGLLLYRVREGTPEVLLVHPGGPFWKNKDDGAWSLPKGEADNGETGEGLLEVAKREFQEETSLTPQGPFAYLGQAMRHDGKKIVEAWAFEGDCDPSQARSNTIIIDWPPRSGRQMEIPEVDRAAFFAIEEAKRKINPYQIGFIDALEKMLKK